MTDTQATAEFSAVLLELKKRRKYSFEMWSRRCGVSASTLHRYCSGKGLPGSFGAVEKIAAACGATRADLLALHRHWMRAQVVREVTERAADPAPPVPVAAVGPAVRPPAPRTVWQVVTAAAVSAVLSITVTQGPTWLRALADAGNRVAVPSPPQAKSVPDARTYVLPLAAQPQIPEGRSCEGTAAEPELVSQESANMISYGGKQDCHGSAVTQEVSTVLQQLVPSTTGGYWVDVTKPTSSGRVVRPDASTLDKVFCVDVGGGGTYRTRSVGSVLSETNQARGGALSLPATIEC